MVVSMVFGCFRRSSQSSSPTKSKAWRSLLSAARAISGSRRNSSRFSRNLTFFYQILEISGEMSRFVFLKNGFLIQVMEICPDSETLDATGCKSDATQRT